MRGAALEKGLDLERMKNEAKLLLATMGRGAPAGKKGGPPALNVDDVVNFFLRRPRLAEWLNFRMRPWSEYARSLSRQDGRSPGSTTRSCGSGWSSSSRR